MNSKGALQLAERYFELSNAGDLEQIRTLFTESSTYSSANTGLYLGADDIILMQEKFFARFNSCNWEIHKSAELKPGIALVDFTFKGLPVEGDAVTFDGLEYVVVYNNKLQHIEIRNKV